MAPSTCECITWARTEGFGLAHHPNCPSFSLDAEIRALVEPLVRGLEAWGSDEDGIHPEAWEAYVRGKRVLGERVPFEDGMDPGAIETLLREDG